MSTRSDVRVKAWFKSLSTRINSRCECGANAITVYSYGEYSGGRFRRILDCCLRCYDRRVLPTLRQRAEELGRPVVPEGRAGTAIPPWMRGANPWDRRLEAIPYNAYVSATRETGEVSRGVVVAREYGTGDVQVATQEAVGSFWVSCDRVEILPVEARPATSSRIPRDAARSERPHAFQVGDRVSDGVDGGEVEALVDSSTVLVRVDGTGASRRYGVDFLRRVAVTEPVEPAHGFRVGDLVSFVGSPNAHARIIELVGRDRIRVRYESTGAEGCYPYGALVALPDGLADPPEPFPVGTVGYVRDDPEIHVACEYDGADIPTYRVRRLDGSSYTARAADLRRADPSLPDEPMQSDAVLLFAIGDTVAEIVNGHGHELTVDSIGREDGVWLIRFSGGNRASACRQHRLRLVRPLEQRGPHPRVGDLAAIRTGRMANARCRVEEVRPTGEVLVRPENGPRRLTYVARALEVIEVARPPEPEAAPVSVPSIPNWALALRRRGGVRPA